MLSTASAQSVKGSTFKTFWPAIVGKGYPEVELAGLSGKTTRLSSFAGKVILVALIDMSDSRSQALAGSLEKGSFNGVQPNLGFQSIERYLQSCRIATDDARLVRVHLLVFGPTGLPPTLAEARAWSEHFDFGQRTNEVILLADDRYANQLSRNFVPGIQLIDKSYVFQCEANSYIPPNMFAARMLK